MRQKADEKRKALRHNVEFIVSIYKNGKLVAPNNRIKNLSVLGCLIVVANKYKFKIGDKVILKIEEQQLLKKFNLLLDSIHAIVRHFDNHNEAYMGLEFMSINDDEKIIIEKIIENKSLLKSFPKSWQLKL
ncbi:PilZ domain-containing protein [Silvanigrella aquatica]|uniref:PilZ domain-containing protein n=1 Tax=Silvanigrella aquatica TaxID=1915309 RepID=A0A1L4CX41_9BACT|nr:PilZ domain-containing protein [Silvanigrella aquatica]APJ02520.1 hypothetical protein AXG55_00650 [Silvanigrella aquatica]